MSTDKPDPSDDDFAAWRQSIADVKPLADKPRVAPRADKPDSAQRRREEAEAVLKEAMYGDIAPEDFDTGDQSQYRRAGVSAGTLRKLRRGQFAIQADLDLHGLNRAGAHAALSEFLREARDQDWRCVRVVHGKGLRSPQGKPVLKSRVEITLQRTASVLAYCSAPNWAGGHGAVLVLLKRRT